MRWLKRNQRKVGLALAGMPLLLVLMVWLPVSAAGAHERASGRTGPGTITVQATPTEDATATELNKEKLVLEIDQLKNQNYWAWTTIGPILVGFAGLLAALYSFITWIRNRQDEQKKQREDRNLEREKRDEEQKRWLEDRQTERERRAEERFQSIVEGLGNASLATQVGAAILLRTFLHPGYEQFYGQVFDLASAHLRLRHLDPDTPEPLDSLNQALVMVFKEAFPLARDWLKQSPRFLDATRVQLDSVYLPWVDLKTVWMREAFLRNANLYMANLSAATLIKTNLSGADLRKANLHAASLVSVNLSGACLDEADLSEAELGLADLSGADLHRTNLHRTSLLETNVSKAKLISANLTEADLYHTDLSGADLSDANLSGVDLHSTNLFGANLMFADLSNANLSGVDLSGIALSAANLDGANLKDAKMTGTDLRKVKGLRKEQLAACKAKGAIIDDDSSISSSQSTISPLQPSQDKSAQDQVVTPDQGSMPTADTGGSNAESSKLSSES